MANTAFSFYKVKYKYPTDTDKGVKWVGCEWLIQAVSPSDAETQLYENESESDLKISSITKTKIERVIIPPK